MSRLTDPRAERRRSIVAALVLLGLAAVATFFAFNPEVPFRRHYELRAIVRSSNELRKNSPVRIAGVRVGKVERVEKGPGALSTVVMRIEPAGLPLHRDATVRIRPRLFLEGGFYVQLEAGSPSAPVAPGGLTLPVTQTTTPVQLYQLLSAFDAPVRERLRTTFDALATGLAGGGADGLRATAPQLAPALWNLARVTQALQGTAPHDVSRLITATGRLTSALGADPVALGTLLHGTNTVAATLARHDTDLQAAIGGLDDVLRAGPSTLRAIDGALPESARALRSVRRALPAAPAALREVLGVTSDLDALIAPGTRERTVAALRTAFRDLPTLVGRLAGLFPTAKPLADCLRTHVVPVLKAEAPDGELASGRPVWQDFVHALVGLGSASQNFDGNGYATRYMFGAGPDLVSTAAIPGLGRLITSIGTTIRSRPQPLPAGTMPPIDLSAPCADQPVPSLDARTSSSGLLPTGRARRAPSITPAALLRGLRDARLPTLTRTP